MDTEIRLAVFNWLDSIAPSKNYVLDWKDLTQGFVFREQKVILIGARGIWKPKQLTKYPISITSVEGSNYPDRVRDDGVLLYSYRGTDPRHPDNVSLKAAMRDRVPVIYLHQIMKGKYFVAWPFYVINDEPSKLQFTLSAENRQALHQGDLFEEPLAQYRRKYETREVLIRLHQSSFRERILKAYREACSICRLKHRELLDAVHIIPDKEEKGEPIVANGISLCKIHHAAYDNFILGISPDYELSVREDILRETDGPMLKYGIQSLSKQKIHLPRKRVNWPDQERLDYRYQQFLSR